MDRTMQIRHLVEAERHVAQGERHLLEQERRLADLDCNGHGTIQGRRLLQNFRDLQMLHVAHRDQILRELEQLAPPRSDGLN